MEKTIPTLIPKSSFCTFLETWLKLFSIPKFDWCCASESQIPVILRGFDLESVASSWVSDSRGWVDSEYSNSVRYDRSSWSLLRYLNLELSLNLDSVFSQYLLIITNFSDTVSVSQQGLDFEPFVCNNCYLIC